MNLYQNLSVIKRARGMSLKTATVTFHLDLQRQNAILSKILSYLTFVGSYIKIGQYIFPKIASLTYNAKTQSYTTNCHALYLCEVISKSAHEEKALEA